MLAKILHMRILSKPRTIKLSQRDERLVFAMQLLGDKTRFKIFKLLLSDKEMCVSQIADQLDISVSAVSQHFRNFEQLGLVDKKRTGQKICYVLRDDDRLVNELVQFTAHATR